VVRAQSEEWRIDAAFAVRELTRGGRFVFVLFGCVFLQIITSFSFLLFSFV
jgi:hypothetical protein